MMLVADLLVYDKLQSTDITSAAWQWALSKIFQTVALPGVSKAKASLPVCFCHQDH